MDQEYKNFEAYLQRGAISNAESMAKHFLLKNPEDERSHVAMARVLQAQGQLNDAIRTLEAVRPRENRFPLALAQLASLLSAIGDHGRATELGREALAISADHPAALRAVGHAAYASGNYAQAAEVLARLTRIAPSEMDAWKTLAMALRRSNRPAPAVQALEYVIASKKADADVWMELVKARIDANQVQMAHKDVVDACKAYPRNKELLALAATVRQLGTRTTDPMQQELEAARDALEKGDMSTARQKIEGLERVHRATRAMKFFRQELAAAQPGVQAHELIVTVNGLMKQYTESWEPRALLADLLMRDGMMRNVPQAVTYAEDAWQMSGGNPRVGATLVRAYRLAGKVALAQALADQLRTLGPEVAARVDRAMAGTR